MGRRARRALILVAVAMPAACGDPLVIVGDNPGVMRIVAGIGDSAGVRIEESAVQSLLTRPLGLAFQATSGELLLADQGATILANGTTRRAARMFSVNSRGDLFTVFTGGGCTLGTCVQEPVQIQRAPDGSLVIADLTGSRLVRLSATRTALTTVAGTGRIDESADGTPATEASFRGVGGVAIADDGTIYFSETGMHRIRTIAPDGTIRTVAGTGFAGHSGDGGPALAAQLALPRGLALYDGTLYIAAFGSHVVRALDLTATTITTVAGTPGVAAFGGDGGSARDARLDEPLALDVSPDGTTLYIADHGNRRVRAVSLATGIISTYAGTGTAGFNGSGRPAGATHLRAPSAVIAGQLGFLFVADSDQHVVWRTSVRLEP